MRTDEPSVSSVMGNGAGKRNCQKSKYLAVGEVVDLLRSVQSAIPPVDQSVRRSKTKKAMMS
jgi:hypothetical protein